MKAMGKCAIVLAIIFFVSIIAGAVMVSVGGASSVNQILNGNVPGFIEKIFSWGGEWLDGGEYVTFSNSIEVDESVEGIEIKDVAFYDIAFKYEDTDMITVEFAGEYPEKYIDKYDIYVEQYITAPVSVTDVSESDVSASDAETEGKLSPIEFEISGGVLSIDFDGPKNGAGFDGTITVIVPEDVTYNYTLDSVVGDIEIVGISASCIELDSCLGDIAISGDFTSFNIRKCLGDIDLSTDCAIEAECEVAENLGDIDIEIGRDSSVRIDKDDNLGDISFEDIDDGEIVISVTENLGDITIEAK